MTTENDPSYLQKFIIDICGVKGLVNYEDGKNYAYLLHERMDQLRREYDENKPVSVNLSFLSQLSERWKRTITIVYTLFSQKYSHFVDLSKLDKFMQTLISVTDEETDSEDQDTSKNEVNLSELLKLLAFFLSIHSPDTFDTDSKYTEEINTTQKLLFKKDTELLVLIIKFFRTIPFTQLHSVIKRFLESASSISQDPGIIVHHILRLLITNHRNEFVEKNQFLDSFDRNRGEMLDSVSKEQETLKYKIEEVEKTARSFKEGYEEYSAKYLSELNKNVEMSNLTIDLKNYKKKYSDMKIENTRLENVNRSCEDEIEKLQAQNEVLIEKFKIIEQIQILCSDLVDKQKKRFIAERKIRELNRSINEFDSRINEIMLQKETLERENHELLKKIDEMKIEHHENLVRKEKEITMSKKKLNNKLDITIKHNKDLKEMILTMEKRLLSQLLDRELMSECVKTNDGLVADLEKVKLENANLRAELENSRKLYIDEPKEFVEELIRSESNSALDKEQEIERIKSDMNLSDLNKSDDTETVKVKEKLDVLQKEMDKKIEVAEQLRSSQDSPTNIFKNLLRTKDENMEAIVRERDNMIAKTREKDEIIEQMRAKVDKLENVCNEKDERIKYFENEHDKMTIVTKKNEEIGEVLKKQIEIKQEEVNTLLNSRLNPNEELSKELIEKWLQEKDNVIHDLERKNENSKRSTSAIMKKLLSAVVELKKENMENKNIILVKQVEYSKEFDTLQLKMKEMHDENSLLRDVLQKDFGGNMRMNEILLRAIVEHKKNLIIEKKKMQIVQQKVGYVENENERLRELIKKYISSNRQKIKDDRNALKQNIKSKLLKMQQSFEGTNDEEYKKIMDEISVADIDIDSNGDEEILETVETAEDEEGVILMRNLDAQFDELEKMKTQTIV